MARSQQSNQDTESPFYVHPSEGPHSVVISPKFNGSNYLAWSRSMQRALGAKNKLSFINGSLPVPDDDDFNKNAWERCNHLVQSWLISSLSDPIAQTVIFHNTAFDVWQDLKERFSKVDRIRIANLRSSINNLKQGSKSVLEYFTELNALWEELHSHRPIPTCTCPHQCRCAAMRVNKEYMIEDQIIQFLTGLNDQFSVVKTQVLLLDPLPSLNKVFSLVVQEESNNVYTPSLPSLEEGSVLVNASDTRRPQGRGRGSSNKSSGRYCSFCNRYNHTIEYCYLKHGFPNKPNPQVNMNSQASMNSQANASSAESSDASNVSGSIGLAQEKIDQLVLLLQQANLVSSVSNPSLAPLLTI
jgi:hypothetical protein